MKLQQKKIALAAVWVLSAIVVISSGQVTSMTDRLPVAIFGMLPLLAMWFWWNDPSQTMSESIHRARDEGRVTRLPSSAARP
jgi:hypothetical protein